LENFTHVHRSAGNVVQLSLAQTMASSRRTADEQVLEAIFNPENPVIDLEASGMIVMH